MLSFNPLKRPNASQCLQHPFFQCHSILLLYGLNIQNQPNSNNKTKTNSGTNISNVKEEKKDNKYKVYSNPQIVKKLSVNVSEPNKEQINSKYSNNKIIKY